MDDEGWHLKREFSIGHIITTATVAGSMFIWAMHTDTRISLLENEIQHAREADTRLEMQIKESITRIEAALIRIEMSMKDKEDKRK